MRIKCKTLFKRGSSQTPQTNEPRNKREARHQLVGVELKSCSDERSSQHKESLSCLFVSLTHSDVCDQAPRDETSSARSHTPSRAGRRRREKKKSKSHVHLVSNNWPPSPPSASRFPGLRSHKIGNLLQTRRRKRARNV